MKRYIALKGGLTCKRKNPYTGIEVYFESDTTTVLPIAISTPMKEGEVFSGKERFQYKIKSQTEWTTDFGYQLTGKDYGYFEYDLKMMSNDFETRLLIEPTSVKETLTYEQAIQFYDKYIQPNLPTSSNKEGETVNYDIVVPLSKKAAKEWDKKQSLEMSRPEDNFINGYLIGWEQCHQQKIQQSQPIESNQLSELELTASRYKEALEDIANFNGDMPFGRAVAIIGGIAKNALIPERKETLINLAKQVKPQATISSKVQSDNESNQLTLDSIVGVVLEWFNNRIEGEIGHLNTPELEYMKNDIIRKLSK